MLHKEVLQLLIPVELGPVAAADLALEGSHLDAAEKSADRLLKESFPESAYGFLTDWERLLAVVPLAGDTVAVRQARCLTRLRARGRMEKAYFVGLAADLGVTVEIRELAPFMAGIGRAGEEVLPPKAFFVWTVKVLAAPGQYFRAGSSVAGESLGSSPIPAVKALFQELKPAHTVCIFP